MIILDRVEKVVDNMKKNKEGFTLIELLAVIVILAIIALIATPIVLNIINNSRTSAALRSAELYIDTVEKTIVEKQMDSQVNLSGSYVIKDGNLYQNDELKLEIKIQNNKPTGESLEIDTNGKISNATLITGKYQFSYDGEEFINTNKVTLNGTSKVTLTNAINGTLTKIKIYGNSIQNGIPTPDNPIEIESVGDFDTSKNKYKIPIKVTNGSNTKTINIYLDEPLRKVGDYADYIDFKNQKVVRNINQIVFNGKEGWLKHQFGTNCYYLNVNNLLIKKNTATINSNYFKGVSYDNRTINENNIVFVDSNYNSINFRNTEYSTVNSFIDFLKKNSVKVNYILKTPTEEKIYLPSIDIPSGNTIIEVATSTKPSKIELDYNSK